MNPNRLFGTCLNVARCLLLSSLFFISNSVFSQVDVTVSGTSPTCNGWTNGSVEATITGGTTPYSIAWSNGATNSQILQSIGAGTYGVTVTDADGMMASASFDLTEPAAIVVTVTTSGGCAGGGDASASVSGGTGGYSYAWDNGDTGSSTSGLSAGVHCVTVTDGSGCQAVGCVTVTDALGLDMVVSGLACNNFCDASVEAVVTGGTPPYTYSWSNGATGSVNENLGPGDYSVTVTDAAGCTITGTATVGNPTAIVINVDVINPACGSGGTGSATASASGGSAPYVYTWSTGAVGPTVTGLIPGTYSVTATDFLGCNESVNVVIVPDDDITLNVSATPSADCGVNNGTASVEVIGGTAPFDISWSNGATSENISNLAPGTYTVMVTDAAGCGASASVTIGGTPNMDLNIVGVNGGCAANGSASANVTPGTGTMPYTYLWSNGATTQIINDLVAGDYSVTVTDANGCTATDQVTVTGASDINVSTNVNDVTCYNGNDGVAIALVSGASGSILFQWSNGENTQMIMDLATGTYFVTVTDMTTGCTATTNAFVGQPTEVVAVATGVDGACNELGSASVSASGGTAPYTYMWSNGATTMEITDLTAGTYTVTATDAAGCTAVASTAVAGGGSLAVDVEIVNPTSGSNINDGVLTANVSGGTAPYDYSWNNGGTTQTIDGLGGGTYSVTVTDVFGCTGSDNVFLEQLGCIGDKVWEDVDRDGCQDPGELGIGGITVTLTGTTDDGDPVNMTMETQPNGFYLFEDLPGGDYTVTFSDIPANFVFTQANSCGDDFTDSDADASGSVSVDLDLGHCNVTVDAGIYDDCLNISEPGQICCDQVLCGPGNDPDPITSVVNASGGGSAVEYMWMFSTEGGPFNSNTWYGIPNSNSASYDPGPLQQTTYFIRCAKASLCDDWLESNSVEIFVDDVAVANITGVNAPCVGDEVWYYADDNGPGATYHWDFGPWATPSTSNDQDVLVTWNQAGVVYITLTVENDGCTSTTEMGVAISDSPVFCGTAFVVNTNDVGNAVMVEWDLEQIGAGFDFVVQRSANGVQFEDLATMPQAASEGMNHYAFADYFPKKGNAFYRVEIRHDGDHMLFSKDELVQRFEDKQLVTYPNPAADVMYVDISTEMSNAVKAEILTLAGTLVRSEQISERTQYSVNMSRLRAGTYFLRLTFDDGEKQVVRIVKD